MADRGLLKSDSALYQRMLRQVSDIVRLADEMGYEGIGFTEHHFHIEGFETSTNPVRWDLFTAMHVNATRSDKGTLDALNRAAFEEAIEIIRLAWTRETFSYDGRFWKIPAGTDWDFR